MPCLRSSSGREQVLRDGLVAYWDYPLSAGTNELQETSGHNLLPGILDGGYSWVDYWTGPMVSCDGATATIELDAPDLGVPTSETWTVAIRANWGHWNEIDTYNTLMRDNTSGSSGTVVMEVPDFSGDVKFRVGGNLIDTDKHISEIRNKELMWILTTDGSLARLYMNGVEVGSGWPGIQSPISPWWIFSEGPSGQRAPGDVGFTAMWNRALTPPEIWSLSDPGICLFPEISPANPFLHGMPPAPTDGNMFYWNWRRRFTGS